MQTQHRAEEMTKQSRLEKIAELLKPSVLYPFNKISHGLLRFEQTIGTGFSIEAVIDFAASDKTGVLPGDELDTGIKVTNSIDALAPDHQLIMLDDGDASIDAAQMDTIKLEQLLEHAAAGNNRVIWFKPPGERAVSVLRRCGAAINVVSETTAPVATSDSFELDSLKAKRVVVAGTGPCMGKYTTALLLQHALERRQVNAASVATEESGFLLSDYCVANAGADRRAALLQKMLVYADHNALILSSGQGGVLDPGPRAWDQPWFITYQIAHFQEFRPHEVVLQVHADDPPEKVEDAISLIRLMSRGKVPIALVVPCARELAYQQYRTFTMTELNAAKEGLEQRFGIPALEILRSEDDLEALVDILMNHLQLGES